MFLTLLLSISTLCPRQCQGLGKHSGCNGVWVCVFEGPQRDQGSSLAAASSLLTSWQGTRKLLQEHTQAKALEEAAQGLL